MNEDKTEFEGPGEHFEATISHSDGSTSLINVGPEDIYYNEDGNLVGVNSADMTPGDTLVDVEYIVTSGK